MCRRRRPSSRRRTDRRRTPAHRRTHRRTRRRVPARRTRRYRRGGDGVRPGAGGRRGTGVGEDVEERLAAAGRQPPRVGDQRRHDLLGAEDPRRVSNASRNSPSPGLVLRCLPVMATLFEAMRMSCRCSGRDRSPCPTGRARRRGRDRLDRRARPAGAGSPVGRRCLRAGKPRPRRGS